MRLIDLTGQIFGALEVVRRGENSPTGQVQWWCRCSCGKEVLVSGLHLRHGHTKSCGCMRAALVSAGKIVHGHSLSGRRTGLYRCWEAMKRRCLAPSCGSFSRYGGRGISVYPQWLEFEAFKRWAESSGYAPGLTIDRIDADKGYAPDNCQWITKSENSKRVDHLPAQVKDRAREMLLSGMSRIAVSRELGVSLGFLSRLRKDLGIADMRRVAKHSSGV